METNPTVARRSATIAFAWGLAEALVFFVVPDVFLTRVALFDLRGAIRSCLWAVVGALIGGAILWTAAARGYAPDLLHAFRWIPGITNDTIAAAGAAMQRDGVVAMFAGAFTGKPYKLFAVHAGAQGIGLVAFLTVSVAARLARFLISTLAAWLMGRVFAAKSRLFLSRAHLLFWLIFYTAFFTMIY
jgi:membrane protein YqaA with SNARE-associated domain